MHTSTLMVFDEVSCLCRSSLDPQSFSGSAALTLWPVLPCIGGRSAEHRCRISSLSQFLHSRSIDRHLFQILSRVGLLL